MDTDPPLGYVIAIIAAVSLVAMTVSLLLLGADILTAIGLGFATAITGAVVGWVWARRA